MKKLLQSVVAAVGLVIATAAPSMAQGLSVNITGTSNYMFRGITQTMDDPAIQGGADYDFGNGLAVGTWLSNVDFGDKTSFEWDLYGSFTAPINDVIGVTVGAVGYFYPNAPGGSDYDFFEVYGGPNFNLGGATVTGRLYYSPDTFGPSNSDYSLYWTGGIAVPFAGFLTATGNVGYSDFELGGDYMDWNLGLAATWQVLTLTGMVTGTDISGDDTEFVGMLTAKFPIP